MGELRIREIFRSVQGESTFAGWPCVFVRTAGCDIRCVYCDETHAFDGGELMTVDEVLGRIRPWDTRLVELTGAEPLLQTALPELIERLLEEGYEVLMETGGHHDISVVDPRVHIILDVKTPGSGMQHHNDLENLNRLRAGDELKFVVCDRRDYEWSCDLVRSHELDRRFPVNFSPVHPGMEPDVLAKWLLDDDLKVRLNLQLHKYIWGTHARGV
jgi:7-carboxy-7-deazaguanine synthase